MKKLLIGILCFAAAHGFAQVRVGVQGSFSSLNFWQSEGYTGLQSGVNTWAINGFQAGVVAEYDLGYSGLVLQPAVMYALNGTHFGNSKGFVNSDNFDIGNSNTTLKVYSIRVPINLLYKFKITDKFKVLAGVGPYFAKNLSGTEKGYYQGDSTNVANPPVLTVPLNNKIKFESGNSISTQGLTRVLPYDIGIDLLVGAEYKRFQASINYSRGFSTEYKTNYVKAGNTFWNFTVAYMIFGHDRKPKL